MTEKTENAKKIIEVLEGAWLASLSHARDPRDPNFSSEAGAGTGYEELLDYLNFAQQEYRMGVEFGQPERIAAAVDLLMHATVAVTAWAMEHEVRFSA